MHETSNQEHAVEAPKSESEPGSESGSKSEAAPPGIAAQPARSSRAAWIRGRFAPLLRLLAALVALGAGLWQLSLELRIFAGRVAYPMDIEWLEGSALYQAYRTLHHQSTYAPPDAGYLPLTHPPGYPTAVYLLGRFIGIDYWTGRTLSIFFFLAACAVVVREVLRHDDESRLEALSLGMLAVGCAAAGVPLFDSFYDLVRDDSMGFALAVFGAALAMKEKMRPRRILLLALVLTAALYTRLVIVFFIVWIVLFVFIRSWRTGIGLALTLASACGLELVVLQLQSKGWYWIWTISMLESQQIVRDRFFGALRLIHTHAPFVVAIPVVVLVLAVTRRLRARTVLWVGLLVFAVPAALLPYAKVGGYANDLMPIAFLVGPVAIFVAADVIRAFRRWPRVARGIRYAICAGGAFFLVKRTFDIKKYIPDADNFKHAQALNDLVKKLDGGVIAPRHPFLPIHNHDPALQFSDMPYLDALWSGFTNLKLGAYIDKTHARWAFVSGTEVPYIASELSSRYALDRVIPSPPRTIIGELSVLKYLLRWQDSEVGGHVLFDFEDPLMPGWTSTGNAFAESPSVARPKGQSPITGVVGARTANSFSSALYDKAVGTLTSPAFTIDKPHMSFKIGGGTSANLRVELKIDGRVERYASPIYESELLFKVIWDVSALQGKEARIVLVDREPGSWGHLLCDQIVLY